MKKLYKWTVLAWAAASAAAAAGPGWSDPVEVLHDDQRVVSYQARLQGPYVVVRAAIEPGWHTFAMDNKVRAEEKLAGKPSLGIDMPTGITLAGGLAAAGTWHQTAPKDFSKPELRWFAFGYEREAVFAAKVRRTGGAPVRVAIRGQACSDSVCKNIDVALTLKAAAGGRVGNGSESPLQGLIAVK